jgi:HAD superfamily hydrolase (TIGR01509 family)
MIKGVIFDLDGVLVDAVEWHYLALNRALSLFGYEIKEAEHRTIYNGLPTAVKLDLMSQRDGFPKSLHGFVNKMKQKYTHQVIDTQCSPNVQLSGLLRYLRAQGYTLGVASNSIRSTVELVLEKMAIREYFDVVLSNEDVDRAKPHPEIYLKSLQMLNLAPDECLIVEDSIPGIQAARQVTPNVAIVAGPAEVTGELISKNISLCNEAAAVPRTGQKKSGYDPSADTIEIVIPMAGLGQRFSAAGYEKPKPLIDVIDKPMIQWVVENIRPKNARSHVTFICNREHMKHYGLEQFLSSIAPGCSIVTAPGVTEGAACTLLLAKEQINNSQPLIIANSDQWVDIDIEDFMSRAIQPDCDGLIMTFRATEKKWSYAKTDEQGKVTQVAEKDPISDHATVGIYYFKHGEDFVEAAQEMVSKDIRTNGEFYVCPVYNQLLEKHRNVFIHEIGRDKMHGLGTPEDLDLFLKWKQAA